MKEEDIIKTLEQKIKKLKKGYQRIEISSEVETLHDYRSDMKKLKAFIRLLNSNRSKGEKIRIGKKMKDVYRLTGDIRNIQLHQQRVTDVIKELELTLPENYLKLLDDEKSAAAAHLKTSVKKLSFHQFSKNILDAVPFKLDDQDIQRYQFQQVNLFAVVVSKENISDDDLHESRKILKDLSNNRDFLPEESSLAIPAFITDKEHAEHVALQLGSFHDLCVSLEFLEASYLEQVESAAEKNTLTEIKKEIWSRYSQLKADLLKALATGFTQRR